MHQLPPSELSYPVKLIEPLIWNEHYVATGFFIIILLTSKRNDILKHVCINKLYFSYTESPDVGLLMWIVFAGLYF